MEAVSAPPSPVAGRDGGGGRDEPKRSSWSSGVAGGGDDLCGEILEANGAAVAGRWSRRRRPRRSVIGFVVPVLSQGRRQPQCKRTRGPPVGRWDRRQWGVGVVAAVVVEDVVPVFVLLILVLLLISMPPASMISPHTPSLTDKGQVDVVHAGDEVPRHHKVVTCNEVGDQCQQHIQKRHG